ncbi:MAG: helix-turn-helix transcriptional regulator [Acidimicrobiales bacterium]
MVLLRRAKDRIDREFALPLDVEAIARGVSMSAGHFSRRFRDAYGEPPYSYLMTRRVERAMTLLRSSEMSVTDVCLAVGFSSLGSFTTRFTELVGVPPSEYRANPPKWASAVAPCVAMRAAKPVRNREAGRSAEA